VRGCASVEFGLFASPERVLLFDVNDFDETQPGPFEWDVKRMAASFEIAGRNNGFSEADTRAAVLASVRAYREAMASFAQMGTMEIWYAHLDEDELMSAIRTAVAGTKKEAKGAKKEKKKEKKKKKKDEKQEKQAKIVGKRAEKLAAKAHTRDSLQALSKLAEQVDGKYRIVSQPPIVVPARDLASAYGLSPDQVVPSIHEQFRAYRATLQDDRRHLLERFEIVDAARKVVSVGSVGTRAFIVLLQGRDAHDPLFLQIKEATASVLEPYVGKSRYRQHGERVVQGQRMMQAASDIYLGWTKGLDVRRRFYWPPGTRPGFCGRSRPARRSSQRVPGPPAMQRKPCPHHEPSRGNDQHHAPRTPQRTPRRVQQCHTDDRPASAVVRQHSSCEPTPR
jgi:uncharacterized protein (DUF2252 family)